MNVTTSSVDTEDYVLESDGVDDSMPLDMLAPRRDAPRQPWLLLWSLHFYILGAIFLGLACYALYSAVDSCRRPQSGPKRASSISSCILAIKVLLFVLGVTRALYMYLYLQFWYDTGKPWKVVENILSNVAYPCLTAGFGLMCQILYEASRLKARSSSKVLASKVLLVIVISFHFVAVVTAVTLIEFVQNFVLMLLLCHGTFIVWGIFLIATFLIFSKRLSKAEKKSSCVLAEIKEKESNSYGVSAGANKEYLHINNSSSPPQKRGKIDTDGGAPKFAVDQESDSGVGNISVFTEKRDNSTMDEKIRTDDKAVLHQNTVTDPSEKSGGESNRGRSSDKNSIQSRISSIFKKTKEGIKSERKGKLHLQDCPAKYSNDKSSPVMKKIRSRKVLENSKQGATPRNTYRVKLTRKVMRIANLTAFLSALCVVLNTFTTVRGLGFYYFQWKLTQTVLYIFNTCFRILELGLGFTMAYFTMQSIKPGSKSEKSFFRRRKKDQNLTSLVTETFRYPSTIDGDRKTPGNK